MPSRRITRRGLTLSEVAISTLLVGVVVVGAMRSVGAVWQTWRITAGRSDGSALAHQILDEVLAQPYEESGGGFGPEAGESNRSNFDDMDDYDDWTESPPADATGNGLAGFTGWTRSIDVKKLNPPNYNTKTDNAPDDGLRRITVTVTDPTGGTTTATALRSDVAGTLQPQGVDRTIVTWVGCDLRVGASGQAVSAGTTVENHAGDRAP